MPLPGPRNRKPLTEFHLHRVAELTAQGLGTSEIAARLALSPNSVTRLKRRLRAPAPQEPKGPSTP